MPGRSYTSQSYRYGFNGHEKDDEVKGSGNSLDFGARMFDPRIAKFLSTDPWEKKYPWQTPYAYFKNSPISQIDWKGFGDDKKTATNPNNSETIHAQAVEQNVNKNPTIVTVEGPASRPPDQGVAGTGYEATVTVVKPNGETGVFDGSSHPNSVSPSDNSPAANTVNEGTYPFSNKFGHDEGQKKGLNLGIDDVSETNERQTPATTPGGQQTTAWYINVHSGFSDKGGFQSRGSAGCITIRPSDAEGFFNMFDFSVGNTGNAYGTVTIKRTSDRDLTNQFMQQKAAQHKLQLRGIY